MPIKKAFYVEDFGEVLRGREPTFTRADFCDGLMESMPAVGPDGENTTTDDFKNQVKRAVGNWLHRKNKAGVIKRAKRTGRAVTYVNPTKQPAAPKPATKAPEVPQDSLSLLDIGKGIEALIQDLTSRRDHWKKSYYDKVRECEELTGQLRDVKVDKENLNRRLNKQNAEIQRLSREASAQKSVVSLREVARFKMKKRRKA